MAQADPKEGIAAFNARAQLEGWPVRCDGDCQFDAPALRNVHDLWRAKAEGGRIPARDAFDLRSLKGDAKAVSIVQLVEDNGGRRYRMRLVGSAIVHTFGEVTGRFLDEIVPPFLLASWHAGYDLALLQSGALRFLSSLQVPGADVFKTESFCAPVRGSGEIPDMILGATAFTQKDGSPVRFR